MSNPSDSLTPERASLLLDFPVRLYTALRTMRLYPASNPQVLRSNDSVLQAFKALLASGTDDSVNIAFSDQKILVCGEHLPDKDQKRPQIQGLITFFSRLKIHSFTFHLAFDTADCAKFLQILSELLGNKELEEPMAATLARAGIKTITVDTKRYVAVHNGEQVVREEMIGSGLDISDEEITNFILGKPGTGSLQSISPELVQELINRLPVAAGPTRQSEGLTEAVIEVLQNLSKETDFGKRKAEIEASATTLSGLDPALLAKLAASLPTTPIADAMLNSTLHQLTPQQRNDLIANFLAQQSGATPGTGHRIQSGPQVDAAAFNRMLGQYEQLLSKEQQTQVAQQAGAQLASMEGLALGNIISQKFKGLFGEQLYHQVITQVSDELLDETVEQLTPKQLNRMIATLTSDIPLQIGKDQDPAFQPADDSVLERLAHTSKGPAIAKAIAQQVDARQMLLNPKTTLDELPDHLLERLKQPEWSAPVLANAAQQIAEAPTGTDGQVDVAAFNRMLGQYEQLLSKEQQTQVAQQAGAQLASMEGLALSNIITQKFRGLFGEQLYRQVIAQVTDQLLDETVEHLTPKQLNRMIAVLTSDIPLQIGKDKDPEFKPADDAVLKRLAHTKKGPEIAEVIAQNIDAHMLQAAPETMPVVPERLAMRLQQPAWSAPVLVAAAQQSIDPANYKNGKVDFSSFERMLTQYDALLDKEKQLQVATQAASRLASMEEKDLGLFLVQKYKNLFGEQLYEQVINHLSDEKLEKITAQMQAIAEGREDSSPDLTDKGIEEAYQRLLQTVRGEKMRAIIEMNQEQKKRQEQEKRRTINDDLDNLLQGSLQGLEKTEVCQALPDTIRDLLRQGKADTADSLLMQLAVALRHPAPLIQTNAAQALAGASEQLVALGQWQRLGKLLPALQQGLLIPGIDEQGIRQGTTAIGGLTDHYLAGNQYDQALATVGFLRTLSTEDAQGTGVNPQRSRQANEILKNLCSQPILEELLNLYLQSKTHQETAGKLLIGMGKQAAKFQLQHLMNNESRFERKQLLSLIKQTGNPATILLLEQLHKESPWFVSRNIIRLLGEIGAPELLAEIRSFTGHADLRVQQEAINTALHIGGEDLKDFLLHALQTVADPLKSKIVTHIATVSDERFVRPLIDLMESSKPFLGKNKDDLHLSICATLGKIGSKRAIASLSRVVQSKNVLGLGGYSNEVRQAAEQALGKIRGGAPASLRAEATQEERAVPEEQGVRAVEPPTETRSAVVADEETQIFALAAQGLRDQAKKRLLDLVIATAKSKDFPTAERLRERIYEIDSLALGEIIRAGEIIEQEKRGAIRGEDLEIWAELTDRLSSEEFQTIYHEFVARRYKPEETIVAQGEKNDALYFINQGSIKVSYLIGERELFITSLNRGQIAGENFFSPSFWTVTLTSLTPASVYILPQEALKTWQEKFPGLRTKLHEFYNACNDIRAMLDKKGLERRQDQRFTLARKVQVQPINNLDTPIGRGFRAETADISLGGLAFLIRISKQENARLLLGRRMQVVLPVGGKDNLLHLKGLVIGIQPFHILENDYSVHFRFETPLESQGLQNILG